MSRLADELDNFPIAPLLAVLVTVGLFVALIASTISFDEWKVGYPLALTAVGAYALGRNVRRSR